MKRLCQRIAETPPTELLILSDAFVSCLEDGCPSQNDQGFTGYPVYRRANLFTLLQGAVEVSVKYWVCTKCNHAMRYSGIWDAVFPVRQRSLYSTELMYHLLEAVLHWSIPVRNAYAVIVGIPSSESNKGKSIGHKKEMTRRRISESIALFIHGLNLNDPCISSMIFSCSECEVALSQKDKRFLGIRDDKTSLKRYKGIVIDGTAAGILGALPPYERKLVVLKAARGLEGQKLVKKKKSQKILKLIISKCLEVIRTVRKLGCTASFSLQPIFSQKEIEILQFYTEPCFCNSNGPHEEHCTKNSEVADIELESPTIPHVLGCLMKISFENGTTDEVANSPGRERTTDSGSESESEQERPEAAAELKWIARLFVEGSNAQFLDAVFQLVDFLVTEHSAYVYLVPSAVTEPTFKPSDTDEYGGGFEFSSPGKPPPFTQDTSMGSISLHESICSTLQIFSSCSHLDTGLCCRDCVQYLTFAARNIMEINPILYRFCTELVLSRAKPREKLIAQNMSHLIALHIQTAKDFFKEMDRKQDVSCKEYNHSYGHAMTVGKRNYEDRTGICFPGREIYRPHIAFDIKERHLCHKKYPHSKRFSPGILTVQCVCDTPKCIGFVIMTQAESTALGLSSIIAHFQVPPRVVYYGNGCNLFASALMRVPWLLHFTRIVVDSFHFKGHTCSSFFDPDYYKSNDGQRSTTAESINARLEKSLSFLRYVKGEIYVSYLSARFAAVNLASMFRRKYGTRDLEDEDHEDLSSFFLENCDCKCVACLVLQAEDSTPVHNKVE